MAVLQPAALILSVHVSQAKLEQPCKIFLETSTRSNSLQTEF